MVVSASQAPGKGTQELTYPITTKDNSKKCLVWLFCHNDANNLFCFLVEKAERMSHHDNIATDHKTYMFCE